MIANYARDLISKGDKVLVRWTFSGILKKEMFGIPPSDNLTTITGFDLFRIASDGKKLVALWQQYLGPVVKKVWHKS